MVSTPQLIEKYDSFNEPELSSEELDQFNDLVDSLTAIASGKDDSSFEQMLKTCPVAQMKQALKAATTSICQKIYQACEAIELPPPPPDDETYSRLEAILTALYIDPVYPNAEQYKSVIRADLDALVWLQDRYVESSLPSLIDKLRKIADMYLPPQITYSQAKQYQELARTMLLAIPNVLLQKEPDPQFVEDIYALFKIAPQETDIDFGEYVMRANNLLFYFQLILDLFMTVQEISHAKDTDLVNQPLGWQNAPFYLKPIALGQDDIWRPIMYALRQSEPVTLQPSGQTNQEIPSSFTPTEPQLDIG